MAGMNRSAFEVPVSTGVATTDQVLILADPSGEARVERASLAAAVAAVGLATTGDGSSSLSVKVLDPVQWLWVFQPPAIGISDLATYTEVTPNVAAGATLVADTNEDINDRLSTNDLGASGAIEADKLCGAINVRAAVAPGDRVLIVDAYGESYGGIYTVTSIGSAGTPWELLRATDFDSDAEQLVVGVYLEDSTGCYAVSDGYGTNSHIDTSGNSNWIVVRDSTSLAAGYNSTAAGDSTIALGYLSFAGPGFGAVAIGNQAVAADTNAIAIGSSVHGITSKTIIGNFSGGAGPGGVVLCGVSTEVTNDATAVIGDTGNLIPVNKGTGVAWTIPPNSSVAFPIGTRFEVVQLGAGAVTVTAGLGVTLTGTKVTAGVGQVIVAIKVATDAWLCSKRT